MNLDITSLNKRLEIVESLFHQQRKNTAATEIIEWNDYNVTDFRFQNIHDLNQQPTTRIGIKDIKEIFERPPLVYPQNIYPIIHATNEIVQIDLSQFFMGNSNIYVSVSDLSSFKNRYHTEYGNTPLYPLENINGISTFSSSNIIIIPDYRGIRYALHVTAIDSDQDLTNYSDIHLYGNALYLDVLELGVPALLTYNSNVVIEFNDAMEAHFDANSFFYHQIDDPKKIMFNIYDISNISGITGLTYSLVSSNLTITQDFRGHDGHDLSYELSLTAHNNIYVESSNAVLFTITERPPIQILKVPPVYTGTDKKITIDLHEFLRTNTNNAYDLSSNVLSVYPLRENIMSSSLPIQTIDNSNLLIYCDYRGTYNGILPTNTAYSIEVVATDSFYVSRPSILNFRVEEVPPPPPVMLQGSLIDLGTLSNVYVECNLYDFFKSSTSNEELQFIPAIDYSVLPTNQKDVFSIVGYTLTVDARALNQADVPAPIYYSIYAVDTLYNVPSTQLTPSKYLQFKLQESLQG